MKTDYGWSNGIGNGTNSSGFSGLPGGARNILGYFNDAGLDGYWWSSSPDGSHARARNLDRNNENVFRYNYVQRLGFSVRCVRDAE